MNKNQLSYMFIDVDCEIGWLISDWQGLNLYVKDVECDIYIHIDWYKLLWLLSWYEKCDCYT